MIWFVGDSHAKASSQGIKDAGCKHLGAVTMKSVGTNGSKVLDTILEQNEIKPEDTVILCFGEIDIRCHTHPGKDNTHDPYAFLERMVDDYLNAVSGSKYKNLWIMNIIPPVREEIWKRRTDPSFPLRGGDGDRVDYTIFANHRLKSGCKRFGIAYLNVYYDYCDRDGMLLEDRSDGSVHVGRTEPIQRELSYLMARPTK